MKRLVLLLLVGVVAACGSPPKTPEAETEYPGVLHAPRELTPDFAVEQHVVVQKGDRRAEFDGVLQKHADDLVLVAFGPMKVRAFVLKQDAAGIHFEQAMGPPMPFPPRNILVDVHRAFFKKLPSPPANGEHKGRLDDEDVTESWQNGTLVERRYERPSFRPGAVRVRYGPGCTAEACEPDTVKVANEWFGYELTITNGRYTRL